MHRRLWLLVGAAAAVLLLAASATATTKVAGKASAARGTPAAMPFAQAFAHTPRTVAARKAKLTTIWAEEQDINGFNNNLNCCNQLAGQYIGNFEAIHGAYNLNEKGVYFKDLVSAASAHPAFEVARAGMPKPLAKTYPLSLATEAVARGVECRADQVVAPRFLRALIKLRGFRGLLDRRVRKVAPDVVRAAEKLAAERGAREASLPDDPAARAPFESSGATARETVSR